MVRVLFVTVLALGSGFAGWIFGTIRPAPATIVEAIDPLGIERRVAEGFGAIDWDSLETMVSSEQWRSLVRQAVEEQAAAGQVIVVERVAAETDHAEVEAYAPVDKGLEPPGPAPEGATFEAALALCPRMTVSNAPAAGPVGEVLNFRPVVRVREAKLAVFPTRDACLSSGFGPRNGRSHRGVDYHSADGGPILAAGDGVVRELKYRDDYGNMVLIDHGGGVFTRYAHLASFERGLAVGAAVEAGQQIGLMGNTASYRVPVHLHYEILVGDYGTPKGSFGLEALDPFALPPAG